jgi:hypothetical protein
LLPLVGLRLTHSQTRYGLSLGHREPPSTLSLPLTPLLALRSRQGMSRGANVRLILTEYQRK